MAQAEGGTGAGWLGSVSGVIRSEGIMFALARRWVVVCGVWMVLFAGRAPAAEPPAPPAVLRARALADGGHFAEARALLRRHMSAPDSPVDDPYEIELEILRRIEHDFRLTPAELLARLRREIPDVTPADMDRWRRAGKLQCRMIDGAIRYFAAEPGNLFRTCAEARRRRCPHPTPAGGFDLPGHLARLLEEADEAGSPLVHPVRHRVRYELVVKRGCPRVRPGAKVRCWLPFPRPTRQQNDIRLIRTEPSGGVVAPPNCPQRTVYFETTLGDSPAPPRFVAEFEFTTRAYIPHLDPADVQPYDRDSDLFRTCTAERPPHILLTPEIRRLAARIVGEETNPLLRARRIFRWVSRNIPWCSEREYSTIRSLSQKALRTRRGDCGVQGMLFITLCRAAGVPARWQSGWQTLPGRWNMHDWSEFYVRPWGWLPADVSYGIQDHPDPRVRDFYCGHLDPWRLIVNADYGRTLCPPKTGFRSEPWDFQRGEIEIDGHNLYFDQWRWHLTLTTRPLDHSIGAVEETLDAIVPDLLDAGHIPGAVIAVGRRTGRGFETWQKAYGWLRVEPRRVPMRDDAIFDLASMTKPIATGTSLMILVQRGRLSLDDPVGKYLPEFARGRKKAITIRHLMTHTSGLPPYVGAAQRRKLIASAGYPCPRAIRAAIRDIQPLRPPGKTVVYSCLNAILCAEIVEAVSGQPLDRFAAAHIFEPLDMVDTGFNPPASKRARCVPTTRSPRADAADGFLCGQVHDPLAGMQAGVSGNAGLFATAADLARFARMMLSGGVLDGRRILSAKSVADMTRIQDPGATNRKGKPDRRGLLWDLYPARRGGAGAAGRFAYGHTGYTGTAIRIYPKPGVYIIALTNRVHPDDTAKVGQFRKAIWDAVGEVLMETPERGSASPGLGRGASPYDRP